MSLSRLQFLRFLGGGAANTALTYVLFVVLREHMAEQVAYTIVYVIGIGLSYFINTWMVFQTRISARSAARFPIAYVAQYLVGVVLLTLLTKAGLDGRLAMLVVIAVTIPLTFVLTRFALSGPSARPLPDKL